GGVITTLIDATCGIAVMAKLDRRVQRVATLDLRIDYLKPATPHRTVRAEATCFRITRHVAFVRASAYHDPDDPVAVASGTFMVFPLEKPAAPTEAK
ncbi:MAG: PaaI family thioesterase, partial [Polyangiaceae bacterium]|nr:PaaI family thioesterase [Polyangiaceae bacterium]